MKRSFAILHACVDDRHRRCAAAPDGFQRGLTLVELLVACTIGLFLSGAVCALFVTCRNAYAMVEDSARIDDNGRYAIEIIGRAVRQAGFVDAVDNLIPPDSHTSAVYGIDDRWLKSTTPALEQPMSASTHHSDVLGLRFGGAGHGDSGDGTILNCAGFGVGLPAEGSAATALNGWSIFYVAMDHSGEPELYCKYRGKTAWTSAAIARGVESFQVLYGVGDSADSLPRRFLTASQIDSMDDQLILPGRTPDQRALNKNRLSHWQRISEIRIALLLRGSLPLRADLPALTYELFGADYAVRFGASDLSSRVQEASIPPAQRNRLRRVFCTTIRLRNPQPALRP